MAKFQAIAMEDWRVGSDAFKNSKAVGRGGSYGKWNPLVVERRDHCKGMSTTRKTKESNMQTDIEILEQRENPTVIWV